MISHIYLIYIYMRCIYISLSRLTSIYLNNRILVSGTHISPLKKGKVGLGWAIPCDFFMFFTPMVGIVYRENLPTIERVTEVSHK